LDVFCGLWRRRKKQQEGEREGEREGAVVAKKRTSFILVVFISVQHL